MRPATSGHEWRFILATRPVYTRRQLAAAGRRPLGSLHLDFGFPDVESFLEAVRAACRRQQEDGSDPA